jgi:rhamnosyltransferase
MNSNIVIALASFNGADFLREQLDSVVAQTEQGWNLLIRDDGSTDNSVAIIQDYAKQDERIRLITDGLTSSHSALGNFSILLQAALTHGAEYIFCCDQDDVWEPDKLKLECAHLKQLEGESVTPSLVHHDLRVVSESLELIADSFVRMMQLQPSDQHNPQRLVSRNEVTGCSMACNRALLEIALPISGQAVMHDWWLGLHAAFFGHLAFMPERLLKYRQHKKNTIGAKSFWHGMNPFTNWVAGWRRGNEEFLGTVKQARAFREVLVTQLGENSEDYAILDLYIGLPSATRRQRLRALRRCGMWRNHVLLDIVLIMRMILLPRDSQR